MMTRLMAGTLVVAALTLGGNRASADENRFAVVTIVNETSDVLVHFSYRWGNGEWKQFRDFRPRQAEWFAIPLDPQGRAPRFEIKINEAVGKAQPINRTFVLAWRAAPDRGTRFGHKHVIRRDASNRDYVGVYNVN